MYNDELQELEVSIDHLYLDPNNPRFWELKPRRVIPDTRITEPSTQTQTEQRIKRHGIEELQYSILRNGFLRIDRLVVRPINGCDGSFVVVEGNRRLAALRLLRRRIDEDSIAEEHISDEQLQRIYRDTSQLHVLNYHGSKTSDISWLLQGIRHISGIRNWEPAQRAKLVADQVDTASVTFTEAGQAFGLSAHAVGRLYRSYNALQQMRSDDEFGARARNDYFSLFEEAYRNSKVRNLLEWDETDHKFKHIENLHQFYAWITPDEDDQPDERRRIHNPKQVRCFGDLLGGDYGTLISKVDRHEIGIEAAAEQAETIGPSETWKDDFLRCIGIIKSLPAEIIAESPTEYRDLVTSMISELTKFKSMAESQLGVDDET